MKVYSERGYITWPSWDAIFEWEDVFAKEWGTEVQALPNTIIDKVKRRLYRALHKAIPGYIRKYKITDKDKMGVLIVMDAEGYYMLPTKNIIPIYLDFARNMIDEIITATRNLPAFFVASKDIYNEMKEKGCENVYFINQCASDQYYSDTVPEKDIDVVQIGRKNPLLHQYMLDYCKEHPEVEYIYQGQNASLSYVSTTRGDIGKLPGRKEFVDMMRRARVSIVSTPKCDNSRDVFGGADLVTARVYESTVFYCHLIGRYTDNEETRELELGKICPNIQDYDEFKTTMDQYLSGKEIDKDLYCSFIDKHLASTRAKYIKKCIEH